MTNETKKYDELPRDGWLAAGRGWRGRCPACGDGKMFRAFLKVADHCPACREDLHHHRADDAPAYFVILIVGHVIVPIVLAVETAFAPAYWIHALIWGPLTLGMSLGLLGPIKGTIVGVQWALRMHGFNPNTPDDGATPIAVGVAEQRR
jgi:uncharacterized protein (DUF983 family)